MNSKRATPHQASPTPWISPSGGEHDGRVGPGRRQQVTPTRRPAATGRHGDPGRVGSAPGGTFDGGSPPAACLGSHRGGSAPDGSPSFHHRGDPHPSGPGKVKPGPDRSRPTADRPYVQPAPSSRMMRMARRCDRGAGPCDGDVRGACRRPDAGRWPRGAGHRGVASDERRPDRRRQPGRPGPVPDDPDPGRVHRPRGRPGAATRSRRVREVRPHAVVLDVNLPDIDGHAVCRALEGRARDRRPSRS